MKNVNYSFILLVSLGLVVFFSCKKFVPKEPFSNEVLAEPLKDLTKTELAKHLKGDELFAKQYTVGNGLGPIFVQSSCENCHAGDGKGSKFNKVIRYGYFENDSIWNEAREIGGPQLQTRAINNFTPESLPNNVNSATLLPLNVTGLGYFAAVEDQYLIDLVKEQEDKGIVSGRLNYITPPEYFEPTATSVPNGNKYIGRFGRKSSSINLTHRVADAFVEDMGLTTTFNESDPINYFETTNSQDNIPNPEISDQHFSDILFYMLTLEAPRRRNEDDDNVIEGEHLFESIGCANCHRPIMKTGDSNIKALDNVEFYPYSDFLLHDMGEMLDDNYTEGNALTSEWRTQPLWGIGLQKDSQGGELYLLHDGRASNFDEAIQYHGGEAEDIKLIYNNMPQEKKKKLFDFLNSL